jgi:hypothetical protein
LGTPCRAGFGRTGGAYYKGRPSTRSWRGKPRAKALTLFCLADLPKSHPRWVTPMLMHADPQLQGPIRPMRPLGPTKKEHPLCQRASGKTRAALRKRGRRHVWFRKCGAGPSHLPHSCACFRSVSMTHRSSVFIGLAVSTMAGTDQERALRTFATSELSKKPWSFGDIDKAYSRRPAF